MHVGIVLVAFAVLRVAGQSCFSPAGSDYSVLHQGAPVFSISGQNGSGYCSSYEATGPGASVFSGGIGVPGDVTNVTGNLTVAGALLVAGSATFGALQVAGNASFAAPAVLAGGATVTGSLTASSLNVSGSVVLSGPLSGSSGTLTIDSNLSVTGANSLSVGGSVAVAGDVHVGSGLTVTGSASYTGTVHTGGPVVVGTDLVIANTSLLQRLAELEASEELTRAMLESQEAIIAEQASLLSVQMALLANQSALIASLMSTCCTAPIDSFGEDECTGARSISVPGTVYYDSTHATTSAELLLPLAFCPRPAADVWFVTQPIASGRTVTISTCRQTLADTVLVVYTGCGGLPIACNDNATCGSNPRASSVNVTATGMPLIVRLGTIGSSPGGLGAFVITIA
eukprot:TRINITY_DN1472_c1_g1_i1.p1 TRINITY_DN1472_c1_g1~~TRINITY_DN1472_c1_g1_i1.p1  ORF type:complete len:399 (+),score=53.49 TRINITY_DN1472_c1_g1_i1:98-1294(+)